MLFRGVDDYTTSRINRALNRVAGLGSLIGDGDTTLLIKELSFAVDEFVSGHVAVQVRVINGAEYVTEVAVECIIISTEDTDVQQPAGPYLQHLTLLAQELPYLRKFRAAMRALIGAEHKFRRDMLPLGLPAAAPHLTTLNLEGNGLKGQLPEDWGNWNSIKELDLSNNDLTGTLPKSWGQAGRMPRNLHVNFLGNANLSGTVPASWAHFSSGSINLGGTRIGGCIPSGLYLDTNPGMLPPCASLAQASAAAPLLALKKLLSRAGAGNSTGLSSWMHGEHGEHCSRRGCWQH
jgi:hypothetical protein